MKIITAQIDRLISSSEDVQLPIISCATYGLDGTMEIGCGGSNHDSLAGRAPPSPS